MRLIHRIYYETTLGHKDDVIKEDVTEEEVYPLMLEYLKKRNYVPDYIRAWYDEDGNITYDYGSYSSFFIWEVK